MLELPRTGTTATTLIDSLPFLPGEYTYGVRKIFWIDEAYVYWQAIRPYSPGGKDYTDYPLHRMAWQAKGPVENLAIMERELSSGWKQGETLWLMDYPLFKDSLESPRLLSLPAAGGIPRVTMSFSRGEWLISGDGNALYFDLQYMNGAYRPGLGRLPTRSGPRMEYPFAGNVRGAWPESDRLVVTDFPSRPWTIWVNVCGRFRWPAARRPRSAASTIRPAMSKPGR
jgi:hypothetical protein